MSFILTGIGAGLASALLTMVIVKATPVAALLYLLAPLPILIVSLGWNHKSGLVATLSGSLALAAIGSPLLGLAFAMMTALPAWWISYLALLGRATPSGAMEWYPVGRLLPWIAATASVSFVAVVALSARGDFAVFQEAVQSSARQAFQAFDGWRVENGGAPVSEDAAQSAAETMSLVLPFLAGAVSTLTSAVYLYLAGRIVLASGRLPRPWPDVPSASMPSNAGIAAVVGGIAVAFLAPDTFGGFLLHCVMGGAFAAFALQGLAAIHDRTRGRSGRGFMLTGLYVILVFGQGIAMMALSLFGLADSIFGLRRRFGAGPNPPPTPST